MILNSPPIDGFGALQPDYVIFFNFLVIEG